jgi:hypothetical protein
MMGTQTRHLSPRTVRKCMPALGQPLTGCAAGYLIHEQTLCDASIDINSDSVNYQNTKFNVTIPANVGPSGKHYVLTAQTLNTDGSYYGAPLESDVFELIGANGTWASYHKEGYTLWGDDGIPCSGFACTKKCAGDFSNGASAPSGSNSTFYECINACPSVSVDESSTRGGQPTAALTTPSPCPSSRSPSATEATTTGEPTATRSRSATAAAGTSAAGPMRLGRSTLLMGFMSVATAFIFN